MRVCIYARVGKKDQVALDMQIKALQAYAAGNGYTVTSMVSVLGTTGTANAQTLQQMLEMADGNLFDAVLATNPSRLSRDSFSYLEFVKAIKARGKTICYAASADDINDGIHDAIQSVYTLLQSSVKTVGAAVPKDETAI